MRSKIKVWLVVAAVFAGYCIVGADDLRMEQGKGWHAMEVGE